MKAITSHSIKTIVKVALLAAVSGGLGLLPLRAAPASKQARIQAGRRVFRHICFACHQMNGQGLPGVYPPLAKSDFLLKNPQRAIGIVMHGRRGAITVNGHKYNNVMPQLGLNDRQIADALTYVLNSWGNSGGAISVADVTQVRQQLASNK